MLEKKLKKVKPLMVGLLMLGSMMVFTYVFTEEARAANTWIVDNQNTPRDFISIGAALASPSVQTGDTIQVNYGSGTYSENNPLAISKSLFIVGMTNQQSQIPTVSAQNSNAHVFQISGSGYPSLIEQFTITGATGSQKAGVYSQVAATSGNEAVVNYCIITGNFYGVWLSSSSSYNIVHGCDITDNSANGIHLYGSHHLIDDCGSYYQTDSGIYQNDGNGIYGIVTYSTISDSSVWDNGGYGIYLTYYQSYSSCNTIEDVEIWENGGRGLSISGDDNTIDGSGSRGILDNNDAGSGTKYDVYIYGNGNLLGDYEIGQDPILTTDYWSGVITVNTDDDDANVIQDCEVHGYNGDEGSYGIILDGGDDISGIGTEVHDCYVGVRAGDSSAISVIDCDNTVYSSGSENFYDNFIGVQICCDGCVVLETYFYITGSAVSGVTGIEIDNSNEYISADIDDCKIEKMWTGIEIIESDSDDHSTIEGCVITSCVYGINIESGGYDDFNYCEVTLCSNYGIYMYYCYDIDITYCSFEDNHYNGTGIKGCGIYAEHNTVYVDIENCDFTHHYCAIWFDDHSTNNNIKYCSIDDYSTGGIESNENWGTYTTEVGLRFSDQSSSNFVQEVEIYKVGFGIGIEGCAYIDIFGDESSDSTMDDIEYYPLYATYYGEYSSNGRVRHYSSDKTQVFLCGTIDEDTVFTYYSLSQTWTVPDPPCDYYSWSEEL